MPTSKPQPIAQLSVVIPALNEIDALPELLRQLNQQSDIALQIVVADGGSTDGTIEAAKKVGAEVMMTPSGRGRQMNAAAAVAQADYLLFLHADSGLTNDRQLSDALSQLKRARERNSHPIAGHFALRFTGSHAPDEFRYRYLQAKTELNRPNTTNGDQAMLIQRDHFFALGCFDESMNFLEDQRFAEKLREQGEWLLLPHRLETSARRFSVEGFGRRYTLMSIIMGMYAVGAKSFFQAAGGIYKSQHEISRLRLAPFIALCGTTLRALPWRQRFRVGGFIAQNAWQLGLMLEVKFRRRLGTGTAGQYRSRWLPFYDRYLAWFFDSLPVAVITSGLAALWFFAVLLPWYRWSDRNSAAKL